MKPDQILEAIKQSNPYKKQLTSLVKKGSAAFSGLLGSASAAVLATLTNDVNNLLIIAPSSAQAEILRSEIELFSGLKTSLFPAPDTVAGEEIQPSKELTGSRLDLLSRWLKGDKLIVVAPIKAVMWRTCKKLRTIDLSLKQKVRLDQVIEQLIEFGYRRFDIVGERGEFSVRGGIIDIFPLNQDQPVRLEFFGDEIESLRSFDTYSQKSLGPLKQISILPAHEPFEAAIFDQLPKDLSIALVEPMELSQAADRQIAEQKSFNSKVKYLAFDQIKELSKGFKRLELSSFLKPGEESDFSAAPGFLNRLAEIPPVAFLVSKHAARLKDELGRDVLEGSLSGGFVFQGKLLLSDKELFGEEIVFRKARVLPAEGVADELLADLKIGDYVVHENYGVALYRGMETLELDNMKQEYLVLEFAHEDKVYVPPSMAGMVEKYSSGGDFKPKLSRLGTLSWARAKGRVKKALKDMTKDLLELYAAREKHEGFAFPGDDVWQTELTGTFPFEETPDQQKAIDETKKDMETTRPMDRLICGDVGYGKTEVAIRAAAKAVSAGKQVGILVPTTILAEQHFNNFIDRFRSSPFTIEMLSRFRTKKEQAAAVDGLANGSVDIVIGTHRLLSQDVKFRDLGLLIVDEEQRFGVAHKEKLKKLKKTVDVLTLSATPIPRTLYLSLAGARSMSVINTPPVDRSPIRTYVLPWNEAVIREAVLRELDRGGQIYFLHNFVETIDGIAAKIKKLVPEAKVAVGHGQMPERKLEQTMIDFLDKKFNVLVCTSIIESGLDITNVNTILIDQADRLGLSQLYQIRGRVGRSAVRAYAYLFYRQEKIMSEQAIERLKAIQEFTALGSGYKLAMRDLEIRGAGNLLGADQSGHIMEVGFDLYCELLEEAVREVKGIKEMTPREVTIDLKLEAFIPDKYVSDERQRIAIYRRMNLLSTKQEVDEMKQELKDRFGQLPDTLLRLFDVLYLKAKALKAGIRHIEEQDNKLIIEKVSGKKIKLDLTGQDKVKLAERGILQ